VILSLNRIQATGQPGRAMAWGKNWPLAPNIVIMASGKKILLEKAARPRRAHGRRQQFFPLSPSARRGFCREE